MKPISLILLILTIASCNSKDRELRETLKLAGDNRGELEKVLDHYSQDPADSLKYRAALYLVKKMADPNMGYLYNGRFDRLMHFVTDSMDSYGLSLQKSRNRLTNKAIRLKRFDAIWAEGVERFGNPQSFVFNTYRDVKTISAKLLIENIDHAFRAWQLPWSRGYSFEEFCQYILPYRYGNEPPESWRGLYRKRLRFVIDSMRGRTDPVEAATCINKHLARDYWGSGNLQIPGRGNLKATHLLKGRMSGNCYDQTGLGCSAMRAMGIATSKIFIPLWGTQAFGHTFNAVYSPQTGEWISFQTGRVHPGENKKEIRTSPPKAFLGHKEAYGNKKNHLGYYQNMRDVTHWFNRTVDITVKLDKYVNKDFAYLCTFSKMSWRPVMWSKIRNSKALFTNMGCGMVYLPMVKKQDRFFTAGTPIRVDATGNITRVKTHAGKRISFEITRKYPADSMNNIWCSDMNGGKFQVADDSLFTDPQEIYTIKSCTSYVPREIAVEQVRARYVRYVFPDIEDAYINGPAWIAFFEKTAGGYEACRGEYLSAHSIPKSSIERVFDEDLLTAVSIFPHKKKINMTLNDMIHYQGSPEDFWLGMDLGKPVNITRIGYCPRNDKNNIYPGMSYELYYWDEKWISLGVKEAESHSITYDNIPEGALLLVECLDEGKERRIFTIDENGKQIWW